MQQIFASHSAGGWDIEDQGVGVVSSGDGPCPRRRRLTPRGLTWQKEGQRAPRGPFY